MIDREEYAKAIEEIRHLRALLAAERFLHDRLRLSVAAELRRAIRPTSERPTDLRRAS